MPTRSRVTGKHEITPTTMTYEPNTTSTAVSVDGSGAAAIRVPQFNATRTTVQNHRTGIYDNRKNTFDPDNLITTTNTTTTDNDTHNTVQNHVTNKTDNNTAIVDPDYLITTTDTTTTTTTTASTTVQIRVTVDKRRRLSLGRSMCRTKPCRNFGVCRVSASRRSGYRCKCRPGFTGRHCSR